MTQPSDPEDGFTLVEVLVSLVLLSLIMGYAILSYHNVQRINAKMDRDAAQDEADAALRAMAQEIEAAPPFFEMNQQTGARVLLFDGKEHTLSFVVTSDGLRETGGLYLVRYEVDDTRTLVSRRRLLRQTDAQAHSIALLRGVDSLTFSYRAPNDAALKTSWESQSSLPAAVQVSVQLDADAPSQLANITVPLKLSDISQ